MVVLHTALKISAFKFHPWLECVPLRKWVASMSSRYMSFNTRRFPVSSCSNPSLTTGCVCTWACGRHPWAPKPRDFDIRSCSNPSLTRGCVVSVPEKMQASLSSKTTRCTATKIPFMNSWEMRCLIPHSCVCERFLYSQDRSTYFLKQNRQIDCGNVEIGTVAAQFPENEYLVRMFGIGSLQCVHFRSCSTCNFSVTRGCPYLRRWKAFMATKPKGFPVRYVLF